MHSQGHAEHSVSTTLDMLRAEETMGCFTRLLAQIHGKSREIADEKCTSEQTPAERIPSHSTPMNMHLHSPSSNGCPDALTNRISSCGTFFRTHRRSLPQSAQPRTGDHAHLLVDPPTGEIRVMASTVARIRARVRAE